MTAAGGGVASWDATFTAQDVPCDATVLRRALYPLHRTHDSGYWTGGPGDDVTGLAERLLTGDAATNARALHRSLLDERRKHGRYSLAYRRLSDCLPLVRPHSGLYTPRRCSCLLTEFAAFTGMLDLLLRTAVRQLGRVNAGEYALLDRLQFSTDSGYLREMPSGDVSAHLGLRGLPPARARYAAQDGLVRVQVHRDRRWQTIDVWLLDAEERGLAPLIEACCRSRNGSGHPACTYGSARMVRDWPARLRPILTGYLRRQLPFCVRDDVPLLLQLGGHELSDVEQQVTLQTLPHWTRPLPELISYARAVAA